MSLTGRKTGNFHYGPTCTPGLGIGEAEKDLTGAERAANQVLLRVNKVGCEVQHDGSEWQHRLTLSILRE